MNRKALNSRNAPFGACTKECQQKTHAPVDGASGRCRRGRRTHHRRHAQAALQSSPVSCTLEACVLRRSQSGGHPVDERAQAGELQWRQAVSEAVSTWRRRWTGHITRRRLAAILKSTQSKLHHMRACTLSVRKEPRPRPVGGSNELQTYCHQWQGMIVPPQ